MLTQDSHPSHFLINYWEIRRYLSSTHNKVNEKTQETDNQPKMSTDHTTKDDRTTSTMRMKTTKSFAVGVTVLLGVCALLRASGGHYGSHTASSAMMRTRRLEDGDPMGMFRASLPDYTLSALDDPNSAQSLAFGWLSNHPDLENISRTAFWRLTQLFALTTIYYSLDGPNWMRDNAWGVTAPSAAAQWLNYSHPECFWDVRWTQACDAEGHLVRLNLDYLKTTTNHSDVNPGVPPEIGLLTSLYRVSYHLEMEVSIEDLLPIQHFSLPNLQSISIQSWGGTLPTEMGNLASTLKFLSIYHNYLLDSGSAFTYGELPTEIGVMTNLMDLTLAGAAFPGMLPTELGNLNQLSRITITGTEANGSIPSEFGLLSGLTQLSLQNNANLDGNLPQLGLLTRASQIDIKNNAIGGSIPSELIGLASVRLLDLSNNRFSSSLPTEIGLATGLVEINLEGNQIDGPIPSEISKLTKLNYLKLSNNLFHAALPTEIGLLSSKLEHFNASFNEITGLVSELGLLTVIHSFDMSHNALNGEIPAEVYQMGPKRGRRSWELDLSHNSLSGKLPPSAIGTLTRLTKMNLQNNKLQGPIPTEFGLLQGMEQLNLASNYFMSSVPSEMGLMTSLMDLDLSNSGLTGEIPEELGDLVLKHDLHSMDITGNVDLRGDVPAGLCELNTNQADYCVYRDTCTFDFDCTNVLCGCECFCTNNVEVSRNGSPFDAP